MTQSTPTECKLQPVNAKLREKIRAKLAKLPDAQAAMLYRENCEGLLVGVAQEGPIVLPPGLSEEQASQFMTQVFARFQQQEAQLVDLMQKLHTRLALLEDE